MLQRLFILTLLFVPSVAFGQTYWGDYQDSNQTEYLYFPTSDDTGAKVTLTGGTLACYEDGGATQFTSGLTLDNDFDSVTGLHQIAVDFSDANFESGKTYTVVLTAGTADGVDLTGSPVVTFSLGRYATAPDGFDGLDIDGAGAVIIQDGTDPGQIDTNGGAVVSVTTTGTVTNGVNVTQFGGTNGTFSGGIPAVNSTQWGGTAVASANVRADVRQILGTTLTDVGSGNFGSTLAGNFSILFGQSTNESNTAIGASEINNILVRTNRIPNIAAGSSGGILIAGGNAPTTFSTLTSTGAMSINGVSNVAQTGDSFARLGAPAGASHAADIADLPNVTEFNAGLAALPQTGDLATPAEINAEVEAGQVGTDTAAIVAKLPSDSAKMAGEGAAAKNLDQVEADAGSIDRAGADMIAARVNASRGEFYPNRNQVWALRRTGGGVTVKNDFEITKKAGESLKVWVDFAGILGRNEAVESIESIDVDGGTATIVVDSEEIVGNLVAVTITGGAADDVTTLQLEVLTTEDQTITVDACTMNVVE